MNVIRLGLVKIKNRYCHNSLRCGNIVYINKRKVNMKKTVYDQITERMIELLEKGVIPWQKPWTT